MEIRPPLAVDPTEAVCRASLAAALPVLLDQLGREEQWVIIGFFYDERSLDELARHLECNPERIAAVLQGALRTLRQQLAAGVILGSEWRS